MTYTLEEIINKSNKYVIPLGRLQGTPMFDLSRNSSNLTYTNASSIIVDCNFCGQKQIPNVKVGGFLKTGGKHFKNHPWTETKIKNLIKDEYIGKFTYDVDEMRESGEKIDKDTMIKIICSDCGQESRVKPREHVKEGKDSKGCQYCENRAISKGYTLTSFLVRARKIHEDKHDYSMVTEEHFNQVDSNGKHLGTKCKIPLKCKMCTIKYEWSPTINDYINGKASCHYCVGKAEYNKKVLSFRTREVHGDNYDVSHITEEELANGSKSYITPFCNICQKPFHKRVQVNDFINHHSGCQRCSDRVSYDLNKLIEKSIEVHGKEAYDLSHLTEEDVGNNKKFIEVKCNKCSDYFNVKLIRYITNRVGCPDCRDKVSKSEGFLEEILKEKQIEYKRRFTLDCLPRKSFDFYFKFKKGDIEFDVIVEVDGIQHFNFCPIFHDDDIEVFEYERQIDVRKTSKAIKEGYTVLRIDYTFFKSDKALREKFDLMLNQITKDISCYYSDDEKYRYIIEGISKLTPDE